MASEFVTVAKLRAEMADVLARLGKEGGPLYLTQRGEPRAVLMDIDEYRGVLQQLEHLDDSVEALLARERREAGQEGTRPLAHVIRDRRTGRPTKATAKAATRRKRARVSG